MCIAYALSFVDSPVLICWTKSIDIYMAIIKLSVCTCWVSRAGNWSKDGSQNIVANMYTQNSLFSHTQMSSRLFSSCFYNLYKIIYLWSKHHQHSAVPVASMHHFIQCLIYSLYRWYIVYVIMHGCVSITVRTSWHHCRS